MEFNATFVACGISFIFFTLIMNKILYKPVQDIVDRRSEYLSVNSSIVEQNSKKAADYIDKRKLKLSEAKVEANGIISNGIQEAKSCKDTELREKHVELSKEVEDSISNLEVEKNSILPELKSDLKMLSECVIDKIICVESRIEIDEGRIDEVMKDV